MWFTLALFSAVVGGVRRSQEEKLLSKFDSFTLGWVMQAVSLLFAAAIMLMARQWINPFQLSIKFWLPLGLATFGFIPINTWLFYGALRRGELSQVMPVQSLGPVFSLITAWVIVRQAPTLIAATGVMLIALGLYVLNINGSRLHNPLRPFLQEKSTLYMLGSTLAVSLVAPLDRIATIASNALFYTAVSTAGAVVVLFLLARARDRQASPPLWENRRHLVSLGLLFGLTYTVFILALSIGPVAYVNSVRSGGVLIGALTGIVLLKEPLTRLKALAFALSGAGLVLISTA